MIYNKAFNKISFFKKQSEVVKITFLFRYISLFITSAFYMINNTTHSIDKKIYVVISLLLSSFIINYLYIKNQESGSKIKVLVLIETIGNVFVLIPSGGLSSPYVWYSINTILISAIHLNRKWTWINLFVYLISSTYIFNIMFDYKLNLTDLLKEESNLILSFILIAEILQLLSKYIKTVQNDRKKLAEINSQLLSANKKIKESINYTMELYQLIHLVINQKNKNDLINLIINYTEKITRTDTVVFFNLKDNENEIIIEGKENKADIKEYIKLNILDDLIESQISYKKINVKNRTFILSTVKSNYKVYGALGIEISSNINDITYKEQLEQLKFLTEISSIVFEKFDLERVNERLVITEEQNRIANEIHDSVLQRLFSISCGIYSLAKNSDKFRLNKLNEELNVIRVSINNVMKELRSAIYGLSWKKEGVNNFTADIINYINENKRLNNIDINFDIDGDIDVLSYVQKKAMYRMICEGIGNAIRHGKASKIDIKLNIKLDVSSLYIVDNGIGFDMNIIRNSKNLGLGIKNIEYLTNSLRGNVEYNSNIGVGTDINIIVPNINDAVKEEAI